MSFVTNNGAAVLNKSYWESGTIKAMLLTNAYSPNRDHKFVSEVVANEATGTNYTGGFAGAGRKSLSGRTATVNNTLNQVDYTFTMPTWTAYNPTLPVGFIALIQEVTTDADSLVLAVLDAPTSQDPGGIDYAPTLPTGRCFRNTT